MKIKDIVKVKKSWHSKFWKIYWKGDFQGKQGEIVEIISQNGNVEGYRVKFPAIYLKRENGRPKRVEDLIWPFRKNDVELVDEKIKPKSKRAYRTGSLLKRRQKTVGEMKQRGMKIKDIAKQMEIPEGTIKRWLHLARNNKKVRSPSQRGSIIPLNELCACKSPNDDTFK